MSRRAQATTNTSTANTNVAPQNKRMSIDGALKIMWNKIAELDKEIILLKGDTIPEVSHKTAPEVSHKTAPVASQQTAPIVNQNQKITSTQPTLAPETEIRNNITQIKRVIETQEKRIKHLETQFGRFTQDIMKTTGSVKTDMETRYSQLNNFLVELQTTQIVMNDKVLKQFNDVVEKNAEEKFKNATTQLQEGEEQLIKEGVQEQIAEVVQQNVEGEEQLVQELVQEVEEQIEVAEEQIEEAEEQIGEGEEQIVQEVAQEVADEVAEKVEQQIAEGEEQTTEEQQTKENITLDVA